MRATRVWTGLAWAACLVVAPLVAQSAPTARDGVFTAAQARRGKAAYAVFCASCHADDLAGTNSGDSGAPPLKHDRFMKGSTVGSMYAKIRRTMPQDAPGTLAEADVLDIVAFLLESNGYPAGPRELPSLPSELDRIRIVPPSQP